MTHSTRVPMDIPLIGQRPQGFSSKNFHFNLTCQFVSSIAGQEYAFQCELARHRAESEQNIGVAPEHVEVPFNFEVSRIIHVAANLAACLMSTFGIPLDGVSVNSSPASE